MCLVLILKQWIVFFGRSIWLATQPPDIQCFRGSVNITASHLHFGEYLLFIYLFIIIIIIINNIIIIIIIYTDT